MDGMMDFINFHHWT